MGELVFPDFKHRATPAQTLRDRKALRRAANQPIGLDTYEHQRRILQIEFWGGVGLGCIYGFASAVVLASLAIWWGAFDWLLTKCMP